MKRLVLFFLFTVVSAVSANNVQQNIHEVRRQYLDALNSIGKSEKFLKSLDKIPVSEPLFYAYKGAAEALIAKNSWNPYTKINYLNKSQHTLKQAVAELPKNAEIRFLRFSIQHYVPAYLGFSANLEEDRIVIIQNLHREMPEVQKVIKNFLIESGRCNEAEIKQLQALKV